MQRARNLNYLKSYANVASVTECDFRQLIVNIAFYWIIRLRFAPVLCQYSYLHTHQTLVSHWLRIHYTFTMIGYRHAQLHFNWSNIRIKLQLSKNQKICFPN